MTKVLVTGGAGFIGSNLVDLLLEEGYSVNVLDNLATGKLSNVSKQATFMKGDIRDKKIVKQALNSIEIIYHFAAQASVSVSMKDPLFDSEVNTLGTLTLLEQAKNSEVDLFVFASTGGAIYGEPNTLPVNENHSERPISVYGTSKLAAEEYVQLYQKLGLKSSILRFANVYGPRQDPFGEAGVISIFLNSIKKNQPLHVFGDGSSSRDYVFVKDVARATLDISKKPFSHHPLNLGSGKETLMKDLIEEIKNVVSRPIDVVYGPERAGDVHRIYLDSSNLENHLNWKTKTSLDDGLSKVWQWLNQE